MRLVVTAVAIGVAIVAVVIAVGAAFGASGARADNARLYELVVSVRSERDNARAQLALASQTLDEVGLSACAMTASEWTEPTTLPERAPRRGVDARLNLAPFDPGWVASADVRTTS